MNGANERIRFLHEQLALHGSSFSCEDIETVFNVLKDVSLKLIVANVPRAVFCHPAAKDAFETLFKSFDKRASFVYLPSFKRAQVFMIEAGSAICARLQTQGWKLPESIRDQLPADCLSSDSSFDGLQCYLDYTQAESDHDEEDAVMDSDNDMTEENAELDANPDEPCTCNWPDTGDSITLDGTLLGETVMGSFEVDIVSPTKPQSPHPTSSTAGNRVGKQLEPIPLTSDIKNRVSTPDALIETTSEASGDDGAMVSVTEIPLVQMIQCKRHAKRRSIGRKMKHLVPPKPSRLFLLSPPASPPVGWEPKPESEPVINYDLLEALAALSPGEAFELHPRNHQQRHPGIVITPCESPQTSVGSRARIIQTRCPDRTI